jgi:putative hydrolase of the HAD superfamily
MMINVLFDIDDTLFPSSEFSSLARSNALTAMMRLGLEGEQNSLRALLDGIIAQKGSNYQGHFDELCKQLGVKDPARYVAAGVAAYHDTKSSIQPFPRVPITLLRLKEMGARLYVATNGNSIKQWDKLIRLNIAFYFDDVYVSEEIGRTKDHQFYEEVLRRINAKPSECVMVGDREDADIEPAKSVGIRTIRILKGKYRDIPSNADHVINEFEEIVDILQRL